MIIQELLRTDGVDYLDLTGPINGARLKIGNGIIEVTERHVDAGKPVDTIEVRIIEGTIAVRPVAGNVVSLTAEFYQGS